MNMEEKDESQDEKPVVLPNSPKLLQSPSQIQVDTTSQNSSRATKDFGSLTPTSDQEGDIIPTMPSLRRKALSSLADPPAPSKKLKIQPAVSSEEEKNEDFTAPPLPESLSKAPPRPLENRQSTSQSLKRSSGSSEDLSTDFIRCFKVMKMEEPNALDDSASSNEQVGTPTSRVSIPTQGGSVPTRPPNNQLSIRHFGAPYFPVREKPKVLLGMTPMMQPSYSKKSPDSPPTLEHNISGLAYLSTPDEKQEITPADQCDKKLIMSPKPTPTSCGSVLSSVDLASTGDRPLAKQYKVQDQLPSSSCTSQKTDEPEVSSRFGNDHYLEISNFKFPESLRSATWRDRKTAMRRIHFKQLMLGPSIQIKNYTTEDREIKSDSSESD